MTDRLTDHLSAFLKITALRKSVRLELHDHDSTPPGPIVKAGHWTIYAHDLYGETPVRAVRVTAPTFEGALAAFVEDHQRAVAEAVQKQKATLDALRALE